MESIFVVYQYENYLHKDDYIPYKKAFLSREEVITFLHQQREEEFKYEKTDKKSEEAKKSIELDLAFNCGRHYGDYHYETEEISLINWQ